MKTLRILIFVTTTLLIYSCAKEEVKQDYRDRFCGTWTGTFSYDVPDIPGYSGTKSQSANIMKGMNENELLIESFGLSYYTIARLDKMTFTYSPFDVCSNQCGVTEGIQYAGKGTLSGNQINENGTMSVYINGTEFKGTWAEQLYKQGSNQQYN
jgi:hypothetical protein